MTFSNPGYISIGDEYDKRDQIPERYKGTNMKVPTSKRGAGSDALFQKKFLSLSEGDKFVDPGLYEKRRRLESEKKKLTPEGFKYTSAPHKPGGSGTYFGTFSERNPPKHEVEFAVTKRGEKPEAASEHKKNFVTNPGKRGTYGMTGLTFGGDFKYESDPYEGEKRREALASKESSKKIVGPSFKAACKRGGFFDETNHGVSKVYSIDKALPAKRPQTDERKTPLAKAWVPGGRLVNEITKFPDYQEDPYEAKEKSMREQKKNEKPLAVWKPVSSSKSLPTKAIRFTPQ